ncbi:MAG: endonuclease III [Thermodesulfovibrionales bacterium]
MTNKDKVREILRLLKKEYPKPQTVLRHKSPFELLVATILSAQTTDVHVNRVTEGLYRKYRTINDYAIVPISELEKDLRSINFFRNKSKHIQGSARMIIDLHGSKVPETMADLIKLPGVARKTANIVLSGAFGIHEGIAVDTHVKRLSNRLGLTKHNDPVKIEQDLMEATQKKEWSNLSHLLIFHGRNVCNARNPKHHECVLFDMCPSNGV